MARQAIPDDVAHFVLTNIASVPCMEAMLLLHGDANRSWDARQVAQRLYMREEFALSLLHALKANGILSAENSAAGEFRFHPVSVELGLLVDRVAECYSKNLVGITNLIHGTTAASSPPENIAPDTFPEL